jgi:hypothetical protein
MNFMFRPLRLGESALEEMVGAASTQNCTQPAAFAQIRDSQVGLLRHDALSHSGCTSEMAAARI